MSMGAACLLTAISAQPSSVASKRPGTRRCPAKISAIAYAARARAARKAAAPALTQIPKYLAAFL